MKAEWLLCKQDVSEVPMSMVYKCEAGSLFANEIDIKRFKLGSREVIILIDGYVIPRMECFENYRACHGGELILCLFDKYGFQFIDYIKGLFLLMIVIEGKFYIYSDQLGIKKFFYTIDGRGRALISSDMRHVTANKQFHEDPTNLFTNVLFNHYIDGKTLVKNVFYSQPATKLSLSADSLAFENYWDVDELLQDKESAYRIDFIADFFKSLTKSYIDYFEPSQVSLSITGGLDCRQILAALLANDIIPRTYTYGHRNSIDVHFGKIVAGEMGLKHSHYYPEAVSKNWYEQLVNEIVATGNSITSIHRAHRVHAIKREAVKADLMFVGYLGGEIVRGNWPDDLIISAFVREYWQGNKNVAQLIDEYGRRNFYRLQKINLEELQSYLASLRFVGKSCEINNFYFLFLVQAFVHYAQDLNLFNDYVKYVVPIFMDIDYLEKIFGSNYSMLFMANMTKSRIRRFNSTYNSCYLVNKIWPPLGSVILSKGYSPRELLSNKVLMLIKRQYRIMQQKNFAPSFQYGKWYYDFLVENLARGGHIEKYFEVDRAIEVIKKHRDVILDERSCLPFTRMLELQLTAKQYNVCV